MVYGERGEEEHAHQSYHALGSHDDVSVVTHAGKCSLREENDPAVKVYPGVFGGDMKVEIINDGPITIVVDTDQL